MRAVIYCRVSTREQTRNLSLPLQRKACSDFCRREGYEVDRVFMEEGESAKTVDRTQLQAMIAYCREQKKRVQFVVVYNLSRFSRESGAHHALRGLFAGLGIKLRSATEPIDDTPTGKLMESMIASFAQFENDVKADRTRAGMRAALESGRWTFQAPVGYQMGSRGGPSLVPDPVQAPIVREAFEMYVAGDFTLRDICRRLQARGLATRRGAPLAPQSLRSLLHNALYAGRIEVPGWRIAGPGDFEAIVPTVVFDRAQARLGGRDRVPETRARNHPDFPLRRFVRCGKCDRPLTGSRSRGRGRGYQYYHCSRCSGMRVRKHELESAFRDLLDRLQPRPEYLRLFDALVLDAWKERREASREECLRLRQQIAGIRQRLDDLDDSFLYRKVVDQRTYERQRDLLREREALAEVDLASATAEDLDVEGVLAFAREVLSNASRLWEHADLDQRLRLQRAFFPEGLRFEGAGFGTAVTCLAFAQLPACACAENGLASPTGFEPVSPP